MKNRFIAQISLLSLLIAIPALGDTASPKSFRTSVGAEFEFVQHGSFGRAVKAPNGMIWSEYQGKFSNDGPLVNGLVSQSAAITQCAKIGGLVPTEGDYLSLSDYFEAEPMRGVRSFTQRGLEDFSAIFPTLKGVLDLPLSTRSNAVVLHRSYGLSAYNASIAFFAINETAYGPAPFGGVDRVSMSAAPQPLICVTSAK